MDNSAGHSHSQKVTARSEKAVGHRRGSCRRRGLSAGYIRVVYAMLLAVSLVGSLHAQTTTFCPVWKFSDGTHSFYGTTPPEPIQAAYDASLARNGPQNVSYSVQSCIVSGQFPSESANCQVLTTCG